ncbi:Baseplate J family protein [Paenibacillus curdlanolyticus YK9]|uniref:Baseplate J family protein n=1 Tax=Paenibacillus curdlanolyticus YK9 TaxID=717606 RepID=E0I815_9BACL|nr:putative baseplate assembly protein [Paenibacillus curdlanolyticus]EFM11320.1 Baseplate J family protein [Paenibacillus curdlanolyticus YK9]
MLPIPNLDDKTFAQLVEDAKKQIPRYAPEWTDYNAHDPGITMLELFAWLAESQRFYLDQVRDDHVRKYLKLLGTAPLSPKPARADVSFSFRDESSTPPLAELGIAMKDAIRVPAGTRLLAGELAFETEQELTVTPASLAAIVTLAGSAMLDQTEAAGHEGLTFMAFGDRAEAGSSLYLGFDQTLAPQTSLSLLFRLYDQYPVPIARAEDEREGEVTPPAKLVWEYMNENAEWSPLQVERDDTGMLTRSGRLQFRTPESCGLHRLFPIMAAACCWFRCTVVEAGYELAPRVDSVTLNSVSAVQLASSLEWLGRSNGLGNQSYALRGGDEIVPESMAVEVFEPLAGDWQAWTRVADWDASVPDDRHYVFDRDSRSIQFGDGLRGMVPPAAASDQTQSIRVSCQRTAGLASNVGAGAIRRFAEEDNELASLLRIDQRSPAIGGANAESLDDAVTRAGKELKQLTRAVTDDDYERLACQTPGLRVARAKALLLDDNAVSVVVVPYSDKPNPQPSSGYQQTVARHLDQHRLLTTRVTVVAPQYVKVQVNTLITMRSGYDSVNVQQEVIAALTRFLHPLEGGATGKGWAFGRTVYRSELYALIDQVPGVDSVERLQLFTAGGDGGLLDEQGNVVIAANALVFSDYHQVEIELPWSWRPAAEGAAYARIGP